MAELQLEQFDHTVKRGSNIDFNSDQFMVLHHIAEGALRNPVGPRRPLRPLDK